MLEKNVGNESFKSAPGSGSRVRRPLTRALLPRLELPPPPPRARRRLSLSSCAQRPASCAALHLRNSARLPRTCVVATTDPERREYNVFVCIAGAAFLTSQRGGRRREIGSQRLGTLNVRHSALPRDVQ